MKILKEMRRKAFLLLLPLGMMLAYLASFFPDWVEKVYSNGFYRLIGQPLSRAMGWFPFSLAEMIIIVLTVQFFWRLIRFLTAGKRKGEGGLFPWLVKLLWAGGLIYFLFIMVWGLNYYRLPFARSANFSLEPFQLEELTELCRDLIEQANELRNRVDQDEKGVMQVKGTKGNVFHRAEKGYARAAYTYPQLSGEYGPPKGVFFLSKVMSYAGISGVYFPFTGEANINISVPDALLPSTVCHEMAHQRGFAREEEANYIAYLTSTLHPDPDFQYSGILLALTHSMNTLYKYDSAKYQELRRNYAEGVTRDLADISAFWERYEGHLDKLSRKINDLYLKANRQKEGIFSYNRMVELLIAEYRMKKGK